MGRPRPLSDGFTKCLPVIESGEFYVILNSGRGDGTIQPVAQPRMGNGTTWSRRGSARRGCGSHAGLYAQSSSAETSPAEIAPTPPGDAPSTANNIPKPSSALKR